MPSWCGSCHPGKRTDAPRMTPSVRIALEDLKLEYIAVVYPRLKRFALAPKVEAVPLNAVPDGALLDRIE